MPSPVPQGGDRSTLTMLFMDTLQMEVGIEDCLHIEFEYDKGRYHLKDTVVGKIYFLLVSEKPASSLLHGQVRSVTHSAALYLGNTCHHTGWRLCCTSVIGLLVRLEGLDLLCLP